MIAALKLAGLVGLGAVATLLAQAWRRLTVAHLLSSAVNVFDRVVFPAPHDPRWHLRGREWCFGEDHAIRLTAGSLRIGEVEIAGGRRAREYREATAKAQEEFARVLALARVEPAIHWEPLAAVTSSSTVLAGGMRPPVLALGETAERSALIDGHILPWSQDLRWKRGKTEMGSFAIHIKNHSIIVFRDGSVYLDTEKWFKHDDAETLWREIDLRVAPNERIDKAGIALKIIRSVGAER